MGHAFASAPAPLDVTIAGRYRVEKLLGQGGMGAVYAVVDTTSGKRLALKQLAPDANATTIALFDREYHTLSGIKHDCIVRVYDFGTDHQGAFYTMELIDGRDLSSVAPLPWREACLHLRDAASVLGVLHARRLIHRDISPRNLLLTHAGRLKLIDFGALASFGPTQQVVGTPPFVAPESLSSTALDQRSDIFGLGALAYWLTTGAHAFPARSLVELPRLWETALSAPSDMLSLLRSKELPLIPPELDALIASMLRIDPGERLASTAELIDRLNTLAELEPESQAATVQGYLESKAFVGRERERERALTLLGEAEQGHVRTLVVEGDAGVGRTRFLQELVVISRLAGAVPIVADEKLGERPFGIAQSLLLGLLRALPEPTRAAVAADPMLSANVPEDLRRELAVGPASPPEHTPAEQRLRTLAALRKAMLGLARDRLLAFFVDDAHAIDEESQALLTALAHDAEGHKLLLVVALGRDATRQPSTALASLRSEGARLRLLPLTARELRALLQSVFGQAPYLERLAERLHAASEGNPGHCLELAQHLVQTGAASYRDGTWSLPAELSPESLPKSRQAAHVAKLDRLSADARALARSLSVPHSAVLTSELWQAVCPLPAARVRELVSELEREGVLRALGPGEHRFAHEEVQSALYRELADDARATSHRQLGEVLAATHEEDGVQQLRSSVHFLRAGDLRRGHAQLHHVYDYFERGDMSRMRVAAPLLEQAYDLLRAHEQDDYGMTGVLSLLAIGGYFAGPAYAKRYGDEAIATSRRVLRLSLALRLTRLLGPKLALLIALVVAGFSFARRGRRSPGLKIAVRHAVGSGASLAGTAATCLDADDAERYAEAIQPFAVLGDDHAATITYQLAAVMVPYLRGNFALAVTRMGALVARLASPVPIRELPDGVKANYEGGNLFMLGLLQSFRASAECLEIADRLERTSVLNAMNADHVRASYYTSVGNLERAAYFARRMEVHAVQLGSAWQVETWAPTDALRTALRTNDASLLKRAVQELARLSGTIPSLQLQEQHARGAYLLLRGKPAEAIPLLGAGADRPVFGWTLAHGALARAHNALGEHARAKAICSAGLKRLGADDLQYVMMTLDLQVQLALAEAGLGQPELAKQQLERLLAEHAVSNNPLTLGSLHQARAEVALRERDFGSARAHVAKMEEHYRSTKLASLVELVVALRQQVERGENPRGSIDTEGAIATAQQVMTRVQLLLSQNSSVLVDRAKRGLQLALELSSADEGFLVLADNDEEPVAHLGSAQPSSELVQWAGQNMLDAAVDEQTVMTAEVHSTAESNYKVVGQTRYCVVPLWEQQDRVPRVIAALVLGFDNRVPRMPEPAVIRAITMHLMGAGY
jgi:predicted Ser/Thr protein kinase